LKFFALQSFPENELVLMVNAQCSIFNTKYPNTSIPNLPAGRQVPNTQLQFHKKYSNIREREPIY
jgi:hypothetical protein